MKYDYDLFVIGAGSGGVRASRMSAALGARVAVAECAALGGTCVNLGCVPKKLFVYGAEFAGDFQDARGYGWDLAVNGFDWPTLRDRKSAEIRRLNQLYGDLLQSAGVAIHEGRARLADAHSIELEGRVFTADKILVATGSWPWLPDIPGRAHAITSNEAFHLPRFPERATIIGGGYIAVEFAGIFAGLGAKTQLHYRGPLFLRGFDEGIRRFVAEELAEKGVELRFNSQLAAIERQGSEYLLNWEDGTSSRTDLVMCATGRRPNTQGLGLAEAGARLEASGAPAVDERYRTSAENIYAIGDVIDRLQLTPVAIAEGACIAGNLFAPGPPRKLCYDDVPTAVFCQPNIGTAGLTEEQARAELGEIQVYESRFRPMKHSLSGRREHTFMKLIVNPADDRVLGVHMAGPEAGEIIQGLAVALKAGATKAQFDATIGIHPTAAEEFVTMREARR